MLSGEPNGTTYISSSAVDGLVQNCVKKVASIKSCVSTISAADGQINIDLKLVVFQDESLPTLCAALQRDVKSYIENATGIPVSNVLVAIVDVAAPRDDGKAGNRQGEIRTFENIIAFIKKHKAMLGLGALGLKLRF